VLLVSPHINHRLSALPRARTFFSSLFFILASNTFATHVLADACPVNDPDAPTYKKPPNFSADETLYTKISADRSSSQANGSTNLFGNVIIDKNLLHIRSDEAHYDQQADTLNVNGNVHIDTPNLSLNADKAVFSLTDSTQQAEFNHAKFIIPKKDAGTENAGSLNMKGKAESIVSGSDDISHLKQAELTSCFLGAPDWLLSADEIELDHADEYGKAHDVVIEFKDIPFLYTPYMEFPISDKRRSGLLFPEFGTSNTRGVEFAQPWYWNIAPDMDAIITPRVMAARGVELGGEYRYLTRSTNGELQGAYLANDKTTDEERYQVRYQQRTSIAPGLNLSIDLQDISDKEYFNDFSNTLGTSSQTHLNRSGRLNYNIKNWKFGALLQDLKTIDTDSNISTRPYARLPQLTLTGEQEILENQLGNALPGGLVFTFDSEVVEFDHEDNNKSTGTRIAVQPGIHLPLSGAYWFLDPALKFNYTQYNVGPDNGQAIDLSSRNLPISSVNTGLFFERDAGAGLTQTLEPRLFYLNVPFRDQDNIPLFDTSSPSFSVAQLFRDNRFIGRDRFGDANQITLALTSRLLNNNSGKEIVRASIGQIFYFQDRRVSLNGTTADDTRKTSDIIAELDTHWQAWSTNIDVQWNPDDNRIIKENYFMQYKSDSEHIFNLGFRKRLNTDNSVNIKQTDTSMVIPLTSKLSAYARWNYSLKDHKHIDVIGGIAYDSCCWSIQLLMQRRLQNSTADNAYDNALLVQFVLKGLGSLSGSKAQTTLTQSILGYEDSLR